jgi:hypothetical protein
LGGQRVREKETARKFNHDAAPEQFESIYKDTKSFIASPRRGIFRCLLLMLYIIFKELSE